MTACAEVDQILREVGTITSSQTSTLGNRKILAGLTEALTIGTTNAVNLTGTPNGFFQNTMIKVLLPRQLQDMETTMRLAGFGPQVDEFILSMNRAAEKAAPLAKPIFHDAIRSMQIADARRILQAGGTAATSYFETKTRHALTTEFKPVIEQAMNSVGVTALYKQLVHHYSALPFLEAPTFDIDEYVLETSLDGLFYTLGQEEKRIRTDPAARVTLLLKEVFGR